MDLSRNPSFGLDGLSNFFKSYTACNQVYNLKSLYLCNTGLDGKWIGINGSKGLQCLVDFMENPLCVISVLDISENTLLRDQGIQPFLMGIVNNTTLTHLNLAETGFQCGDTPGAIADVLIGNKVRRHTHTCTCPIVSYAREGRKEILMCVIFLKYCY